MQKQLWQVRMEPFEILFNVAVDPSAHVPGVFAVELTGKFIGVVSLDRRDRERPGHLRESGDEVEISYTFLPASWGHGFVSEAVAAVLGWAKTNLPNEPIVLCTQVANEPSLRVAARLGFRESRDLSNMAPSNGSECRTTKPAAASRNPGSTHTAITYPLTASASNYPREKAIR